MRVLACTALVAALILLSSACARRDAAYRFRAPVVSSVRAERLPARAPAAAGTSAVAARDATARSWLAAPPHARGTAPQRTAQPPARSTTPASPAAALRALAGRATRATGAELALATLAELGAHLDPRVREATTGARLLALARERGAVLTDGVPLTGDLVVLAPEGDADLVVGIVITAPERAAATVEILYPGDGAVRHALVASPRACRARGADAPDNCVSPARVRAYLLLDRLAP